MKKKALQIIILIILLFTGIELFLKNIEVKLSKDTHHYKQMDSIIHNLTTSKEKSKFLFIGNSLTREGIDKQLLKDRLTSTSISSIHPDDTTINEWYWIYNKAAKEDLKNTVIIVPFSLNQLADKSLQEQNIISIANIVNIQDLPKVYKFENLNLSDSIKMFLAHNSTIFSNRERIQRRVLDFLPHYREAIRTINRAIKKESVNKKIPKYYKHLQGLLKLAKVKNTPVIFVALPLPYHYDIDTKLQMIICQHNYASLIDARTLNNIDKNDFSDGYHLNESGAKKLSDFLIPLLQNSNN